MLTLEKVIDVAIQTARDISQDDDISEELEVFLNQFVENLSVEYPENVTVEELKRRLDIK